MLYFTHLQIRGVIYTLSVSLIIYTPNLIPCEDFKTQWYTIKVHQFMLQLK